jgi:hypothetical protein
MKTARELAHTQEAFYEDCPGPLLPVGKHAPSCDRLTRAIEERDRELVEACAKIADRSNLRTGARIRSLLPAKDPT